MNTNSTSSKCFRSRIIVSGVLPRTFNKFKVDRTSQDSFLSSCNRRSAELNVSLEKELQRFSLLKFVDHPNFETGLLSTDGLHLRPKGVQHLASNLLTAIHACVLSAASPTPCWSEQDFPPLSVTAPISVSAKICQPLIVPKQATRSHVIRPAPCQAPAVYVEQDDTPPVSVISYVGGGIDEQDKTPAISFPGVAVPKDDNNPTALFLMAILLNLVKFPQQ